jgi:hypothetical protein
MTGWELHSLADMSLLVVIEYVESPEQLETGGRKQLLTIFHAPLALEFAEALKNAATLQIAPTFQTKV